MIIEFFTIGICAYAATKAHKDTQNLPAKIAMLGLITCPVILVLM